MLLSKVQCEVHKSSLSPPFHGSTCAQQLFVAATMERWWHLTLVLLLFSSLSSSAALAYPTMVPSYDVVVPASYDGTDEDDAGGHLGEEEVLELLDLDATVLQLLAVTDAENCTRLSLARLNYDFSVPADKTFGRDVRGALQTANLLNSIFQARRSPRLPSTTSSSADSPNMYVSLVQALVEGTPAAYGGGIAFVRGGSPVGGAHSFNGLFAPFVHRTTLDDGPSRRLHLRNLAELWDQGYDRTSVSGTDWFVRAVGLPVPRGHVTDMTPEGPDVYNVSRFALGAQVNGVWSKPFFDCGGSNTWLIAYAVPFYAVSEVKLVVKGVVVVMFDLSSIDINQCASDNSFFADTHKCERQTMQCHPTSRHGLHLGAYTCTCKPGFYFPASETQPVAFNGSYVEGLHLAKEKRGSDWRCLPCRPGCDFCVDEAPCFVEYDIFLRALPLGVESFCMTITIVLGIAVFRLRKAASIAAGMWPMLEMILVGGLLLYATVVCRYFEPTTLSCLLEPWFRELGFATLYGAIILKIYRILVEFRTRKAHRWVIKDKDLLKYLAGILLVVIGYMAAWTAINMHLLQDGHSILSLGLNNDGLRFFKCRAVWWEHVTEIGELLFLLFGVYLSYHVRNASSDFREKRYLCFAIFIELIVSLTLNITRRVLELDKDPDFIFLLYFGRCQITVTLILFFIFAPKLWYYRKPPSEGDGSERGAQQSMKLQDGITSNGEVDIGDINLADMDPEDIRAELHRVYTQLQILRNKTMRKDNPHISKRRGGRKATHRRFSLQAFHHRHRHHHESEVDGEVSKTPEESIASTDGATVPTETTTTTTATMAPSTTTVSAMTGFESSTPTLTVTFKDIN